MEGMVTDLTLTTDDQTRFEEYLSSLIISVIALHNLINNKMHNKEHEKAEYSMPIVVPTAAGRTFVGLKALKTINERKHSEINLVFDPGAIDISLAALGGSSIQGYYQHTGSCYKEWKMTNYRVVEFDFLDELTDMRNEFTDVAFEMKVSDTNMIFDLGVDIFCVLNFEVDVGRRGSRGSVQESEKMDLLFLILVMIVLATTNIKNCCYSIMIKVAYLHGLSAGDMRVVIEAYLFFILLLVHILEICDIGRGQEVMQVVDLLYNNKLQSCFMDGCAAAMDLFFKEIAPSMNIDPWGQGSQNRGSNVMTMEVIDELRDSGLEMQKEFRNCPN